MSLYLGGAYLRSPPAFALAGWRGVVAMLAVAAYASCKLLLSDYGCSTMAAFRTRQKKDAKPKPVGPSTAGMAPHGIPRMMLNAPRHFRPPYAALRRFSGTRLIPRALMPLLTRSLPVMAVLALVHRFGVRVMDRRWPAGSP